ncbi:hypothetical protein [Synechococcus sp. 1G10]|uniref:hypothetical protein n=1 Tax=Synechococcus sp. 1G10 TaxID=2025605 RepID=UPI000B987F9D|nr:hypothetical protein [Synechococcus sp. 1G10]
MATASTLAKASPKRQQRVSEQVAPLVVKGYSVRRIAAELGIDRNAAYRDIKLVKSTWKATLADAGEEWRAKALAQHEFVLQELHEQWEIAKQGKKTATRHPDGSETIKHEPVDLKPLSGIVATVKEITTFLGIREGADTVARIEVDESTRNALAPMDRDSYMALVANGMPSITVDARPRAEGVIDVEPLESAE